MTKEENRRRIKSEALNKIRKIYNPKTKNNYSDYSADGSYSEQRDNWIRRIIVDMEEELSKL